MTAYDEQGRQRDGVPGVDVAHGALPARVRGAARAAPAPDELGVLAPALGQRDLELLVAHGVLQHLDLVAHAEQPHEDQGERDEAEQQRPEHGAVDVDLEPGIDDGAALVQRLPPVHREVHDRARRRR